MTISVKICGLTRAWDVAAAIAAGATFVGVVFSRFSPRFVSPEQAAKILYAVPKNICKVGLFVNPNDAWLVEVMSHVHLDMVQLHGQESVERVSTVRRVSGLPVIKAIAIQTSSDCEVARDYLQVADWLLFDSKSANTDCPGGHGTTFDWNQLRSQTFWPRPWMLAGGLTPTNVIEAIRCTGATTVDVSSGVEEHLGIKSAPKIHAFLETVKGL